MYSSVIAVLPGPAQNFTWVSETQATARFIGDSESREGMETIFALRPHFAGALFTPTSFQVFPSSS